MLSKVGLVIWKLNFKQAIFSRIFKAASNQFCSSSIATEKRCTTKRGPPLVKRTARTNRKRKKMPRSKSPSWQKKTGAAEETSPEIASRRSSRRTARRWRERRSSRRWTRQNRKLKTPFREQNCFRPPSEPRPTSCRRWSWALSRRQQRHKRRRRWRRRPRRCPLQTRRPEGRTLGRNFCQAFRLRMTYRLYCHQDTFFNRKLPPPKLSRFMIISNNLTRSRCHT